MTALRFDTISFLSDYGRSDEFVGVVHSVIRSLAPGVSVIDVTHDIEPFNVRAGGLALARASQYLAPGVVLGVVDPGVGTDRRPVAIEVGDGQSYLVGPDNGLLASVVAMVGGATGAIVLDNTDYHLAAPGPTFAGRDVFAPVAAHLCLGVPPSELGTPIDPIQLLPGILPVSEIGDDGTITAEVLWVDRFGNVQLNVDPEEISTWPDVVRLNGGQGQRVAHRVANFAATPTNGIGLIIDSYGLLSIVSNRGSAAEELGLWESEEVTLAPVAETETGLESPVQLTTKPPAEKNL